MLHRAQAKSFLRWSQYFFFALGILALGYVAFALGEAKIYQAYQTWRFHQALQDARPAAGAEESLQPLSLSPALAEANRERAESLAMAGRGGSPLGRIEISAIGIAAMIVEGVDDRTLRRAVGHIPGTSLPGQKGNVAIAGHRDTFFRGLRNIRKNDEITLTTLHGFYRYRVDSIKVVQPQDTEVLDDSYDAILTLVTCYPFYFVGSAPQRFIVRAHKSFG
jgi:sortase A